MKIVVTARGPSLDDQVDPRFGRCPYFLIIDTETLEFEAIQNPNAAAGGGAGVLSAQLIAERDAKALLTGNCGPNAYQTLQTAGIDVIVGVSGRIRDAVEQFKAGSLAPTGEPSVASRFGVGGSGAAPHLGAGMGWGRGMGGGWGRGGGRGIGRGRGMGRGAGMPLSTAPMRTEEASALRAEAENLKAQLEAINERIAQLEGMSTAQHPVATVDAERCTACGRCASVCPVEAITINAVAVVDADRCNGCGLCVPECPREAIRLRHLERNRSSSILM